MFDNLVRQWHESSAGKAYAGLGERDRLAVLGLGGFLAVVICYLAVWQPVSDWFSTADGRYQRQLSVLEWMHAHETEARASARASAAQRGGTNSMLSVVSSTADRAGVKLTRFQPEGSGGVSVVIQNQPFNAVLRWLDELSRERISVRQLSIDRQGQSGLVNGRINLI